MRAAIRQKLIDSIPKIEGRVYEPQAAGATTQKPYLVLRQGVDAEESLWAGFRRIIEVFPYVSRTTFQKVDELANKVIEVLDKQLLTDATTGEVFTCQYLGTVGQDFIDEDWDAITRGLRFAVMALQPVAVKETVASDTWVEALASWAENLLGGEWTVYRNRWPLGYVRPAVLWRLADISAVGTSRATFDVRKLMAGHVLGATPNQETVAMLQIVQGLTQAIKVPLDLANRKYMTVVEPRGDYRMDALTRGQISVTLTRMTMRPFEEAPLMQKIEATGGWQ